MSEKPRLVRFNRRSIEDQRRKKVEALTFSYSNNLKQQNLFLQNIFPSKIILNDADKDQSYLLKN